MGVIDAAGTVSRQREGAKSVSSFKKKKYLIEFTIKHNLSNVVDDFQLGANCYITRVVYA